MKSEMTSKCVLRSSVQTGVDQRNVARNAKNRVQLSNWESFVLKLVPRASWLLYLNLFVLVCRSILVNSFGGNPTDLFAFTNCCGPGCGICIKKCPFEAINIINLPKDLDKNTTHRYGPNSFKLHRLPMPRPGQVLGLVGTNGIGKSTALKILAGKMKPNLGRFDNPPDWEEILVHFRGSELQNYFTKILEDTMKATIKPQYVDHIPRAIKGSVGQLLKEKDDRSEAEGWDVFQWAIEEAELGHLLERDVRVLSGGELQRFAIAAVAVQISDVYMFDEPSSYLDVKQRLTAASMIRQILQTADGYRRYVLVVEHDLAVLDYLSDFVCVLYGSPGAYGVVTMPHSVRAGINAFLAGYIHSENMRFREYALTFKVSARSEEFLIDDTYG